MNATKISYVDMSWNPVTGCTDELPCWSYCWARRMAARQRGRAGYPEDDPFRPTFHPERLGQPARIKTPKTIAVCFMGDLWNAQVESTWREVVFYAAAKAPQHTYLFLTKRPERVSDEIDWLAMPNWWLGTSVEDQATADERIPHLMRCGAAHRWFSIEPMRGPIDLRLFDPQVGPDHMLAPKLYRGNMVHWVVLGGGPFPVHPVWARMVRDQCRSAYVPFFFKQWGEWIPRIESRGALVVSGNGRRVRVIGMDGNPAGPENAPYAAVERIGKKAAGCDLDGREWHETPWDDGELPV
jgi:protein gp37